MIKKLHTVIAITIKEKSTPQLVSRIFVLFGVLFFLYFVRDIAAELPLQAFSAFYSSGCSEEHFEGNSPIAKAILKHIKKECSVSQNEKNIIVNLKDFTPFKWDTLHVITPYIMKMDIVRKVGLNGNVLKCSKSGFYDEWTQLIFQLDGEVIAFFDISSALFSFGYKKEYSIEDAQIPVFCPVCPQ